jgi:hypothetical protein
LSIKLYTVTRMDGVTTKIDRRSLELLRWMSDVQLAANGWHQQSVNAACQQAEADDEYLHQKRQETACTA